jgi:DNA helicase-2/ATP-dependent DNA helicase PcrA
VFITGLEEGIFPIIHQDQDDDIEEERRLFYVAITRAKRMLYITHANDRMKFGNHEMKSRSRFLKEIPSECIEEKDPMSFAAKKLESLEKVDYSSTKRPSLVKNNFFKGSFDFEEKEDKPRLKSDKIQPGDKVMHKAWGVGTVVQIKDEGDSKVIVIAFENKGLKNLNLEYAPIVKI